MHHDHHCRIARQRTEVLSARSLLTLAVSDALAACRQAATTSRRRDAQAALVLATAVAFAAASVPAHAQSVWTGAESPDWFTEGNWTNGIPGNGMWVTIDTRTSPPVVIEHGNAISGRTTLDGGARVTGADATWGISEGLIVGYQGSGTLFIGDGAQVSVDVASVIGTSTRSVSEVMVSGAGSRWVNSGHLEIGHFGTGSLTIQDGGQASNTLGTIGYYLSSVGKVTVTGNGSRWDNSDQLYVGQGGTGTLTIQDGGVVSNTFGWLGLEGASSSGEVTVTGAGSSWANANDLFVGYMGTGTLLVEAGGTVSSKNAFIGNEAGSVGEATVTGSGSTWNNTGALTVGKEGQGVLEILDGGHVESASGSIGTSMGLDNRVKVSGADSAGVGSSWNNAGDLFVGNSGKGYLDIVAGGTVSGNGTTIGRSGGDGTVEVSGAGSSLVVMDYLRLGHLGSSTGRLAILDGGLVDVKYRVTLGDSPGSTGIARVDGGGSALAIEGDLFVSNAGWGTLDILAGGQVSSVNGVIGSEPGGGQANGTVTVAGIDSATRIASSWTVSAALYVGRGGVGTLTIADGGLVDVDSALEIGKLAGSAGILNIGAGGAAGLLDTAAVTGGAGTAILNFNHDEANYAFTKDGTVGGDAIVIAGSTAVNQIGTGTTVLTGAHAYTGTTNVNAGTLLVEGSLGNTATTVADGATLGGSGSIAGAVTIADGGILAPGSSAGTLTVGSLSLSSGSILDYELGQADTVVDGVNDLIKVTGNLTLDGTLDITDIGGFGAGVYRLINYGGDLIDNGLEIGTRPTGVDANDLFVQTNSSAGQVNLVSTAGLMLGFWDGATAHDNDAIDGGSGTWDVGNSNWTTASGAMNGRWDDGAFAVFGGTAENVDVVGEQAIAGLQFMSGYTLTTGTDGALRIDGADSVIRVDPDVTATIDVGISGAGGLVKTDTGTLVLSGENTYEGGTRIDLGTLQVTSDGNLGEAAGGLAFDGGTLQTTAAFDSARNVDLQAGGGTFLTDANLGLGGVISGAGTLTKDGDGTLTLAGENTYTGGTRVLDGTLVGDTGSIRGNLANTGTVVFDQADDDTFAGAIAGDGAMAKRGAGALTLTGNSTLDWDIDAGMLVATGGFGGNAAIADGARLRLGQAGNTTYAGVLSGTGAFVSGGSGTRVLTGDSSAFAGTTGIDAGTLQVDGLLGGSVEVGNGAALAGDGTLGGAVRVLDGGRLAPGAGVGTLTVGSLWLSEGATLDYGLGQAGTIGGGANDLLEVIGDLTLDGTLDITDVGGFGAGVYRLINYSGDLTDNVLDIGVLPDGFETEDLLVQALGDGHINLVNSAGVVLGFWDGDAGPTDDGAIQGGDGVWTSVDRSWTDANGAINGGWSAGFAVFGGEAGTVTVDGTQAFTGLQFMTDGYRITGDVLAMDTAQTIVRVDPGVTATIDSMLTGSGALVKHDAGTLVLSGENSYAGGTQLLGGVLAIGNDANLGAADGALDFDGGGLRLGAAFDSVRDITVGDGGGALDSGAFDNTLAGVFSGSGTFTRIGSGTLTLVGASQGFGGTFALQSGELRVDGSLGGMLAIANGAWLTGIGTLHDVDNHGTVAAGHSIGTLTFTGDYIHRDDATLLAEIEPGGNSDLLDIAGSATIEGGTVQVIKLPGQYEGGTRYTLIDAAGGVTGTFGTLGQDLPFLDLLLGYDANHVYLDVQRNEVDFDIVCGTGTFNQCQVAGALDAVGHDHPIPDDLKTVLTEVTSLTLPGAQAAFDTLSGEAHASAAGAMLEGHALYGQTVTRRLAERREAMGAQRLQGGAWARGYGMGSELDGDGNAHGARLELYGLAAGVDAWATESWLIGASVNTLKLDADFRAGDGAEADAKNVSLYTSVQGERGYLDAVASFAWWNSDITRRIEVGSLAREARSDYGMDRVALALEAGLTYDLGNSTLQPLLSVEYSKLSTEGFREDGADEVDLIARSQDVERTAAGAGVRWTGAFGVGAWTFAPTAQARWLHTFGDLDAEFDVAFAGAPDASFRVRGVTVPEDRGLVGIGLQASRDTLDVFADVDYQAGDGFKSASFGAGLRWRW